MPRVFKLFRAMGLRHIVVVNDSNEVKKTFFKILYYYYINIIIYKPVCIPNYMIDISDCWYCHAQRFSSV